eukprot:jgi/Mesvir1/12958/Mv05971-RA.1
MEGLPRIRTTSSLAPLGRKSNLAPKDLAAPAAQTLAPLRAPLRAAAPAPAEQSDEEGQAIKIQSAFRGYKARKSYNELRRSGDRESGQGDVHQINDDPEEDRPMRANQPARQAKPDTQVEDMSGGDDDDDSFDAVRPRKAGPPGPPRRQLSNVRAPAEREDWEAEPAPPRRQPSNLRAAAEREAREATKIQSAFRGYRVRKSHDLRSSRDSQASLDNSVDNSVDEEGDAGGRAPAQGALARKPSLEPAAAPRAGKPGALAPLRGPGGQAPTAEVVDARPLQRLPSRLAYAAGKAPAREISSGSEDDEEGGRGYRGRGMGGQATQGKPRERSPDPGERHEGQPRVKRRDSQREQRRENDEDPEDGGEGMRDGRRDERGLKRQESTRQPPAPPPRDRSPDPGDRSEDDRLPPRAQGEATRQRGRSPTRRAPQEALARDSRQQPGVMMVEDDASEGELPPVYEGPKRTSGRSANASGTASGKSARFSVSASQGGRARRRSPDPGASNRSQSNKGLVSMTKKRDWKRSESHVLRDKEARRVKEWQMFMLRSRGGCVTPMPHQRPVTGEDRVPYRLRIHYVSAVPVPPPLLQQTASLELRVSVSLFDEGCNTFIGNTCETATVDWLQSIQQADARSCRDADLQLDVFFATPIIDPRCVLVVELVVSDRRDGILLGESSAGWAALPLVPSVQPMLPPRNVIDRVMANVAAAGSATFDVSAAQCAWVKGGTPRYLLFREFPGCERPLQLPDCVMVYELGPCPSLLPVMHLLPDNFFCTYGDLVPGIVRLDSMDKPTLRRQNIFTVLDRPEAMPTIAGSISSLYITLPPGFIALFEGMILDNATAANPAVPAGQGYSDFQLRAGIHNGRHFVQKLVCTNQFRYHPQRNTLELVTPLPVRGMHVDPFMAVIFQLVYTGKQPKVKPFEVSTELLEAGVGTGTRTIPIAWAPILPFTTEGLFRDGQWEVPLRSGPGAWCHGEPLFDWQTSLALLSPGVVIPPPTLRFQLHEELGTPLEDDRSSVSSVGAQRRAREEPYSMGEDMGARKVPKAIPEGSPAASEAGFHADGDSKPWPSPPPFSLSRALEEDERDEAAARRAKSRDAPPTMYPLGGLSPETAQGMAAMREQLSTLAQAVLRIESAVTDEIAFQRKSMDFYSTDKREKERAAVTIQKHYRGHATRMQHAPPVWGQMGVAELGQAEGSRGREDPSLFAGGVAEQEGAGEKQPSRATRARLHAAGALDVLPREVQALLAKGVMPEESLQARRGLPLDMGVENADPRVVNDVLIQVLAFTPPTGYGLTSVPETLYFTFQMYDFAPMTSELVRLKAPKRGGGLRKGACLLERERESVRGETGGGAPPLGILFKYSVDPTRAEDGDAVDPQAVSTRRMHFCRYLRDKELHVDVWDGASLLQVGTAPIKLRGLLRQGREVVEELLECVVLDPSDSLPDSSARNRQRRAALQQQLTGAPPAPPGVDPNDAAGWDAAAPMPTKDGAPPRPPDVSRGSLLIRLINIGREGGSPWQGMPLAPMDNGQRPVRPGAVDSSGKKRVVRVRAALDTNGLIAQQVARVVVSRAPPRVSRREAGAGAEGSSDGGGKEGREGAEGEDAVPDPLPRNLREKLEQAERRKLARLHRLELLKHGRVRGEGVDSEQDIDRQVREAMLHDVQHLRDRYKQEVISGMLKKSARNTRVIHPCYGELVFFEHPFRNPFGRQAVFNIECDDPELALVTDVEEWRLLRRVHDMAGGHFEEDLFENGSQLFLAAHEVVTIGFKFQSFCHGDLRHPGNSGGGNSGAASTPAHRDAAPSGWQSGPITARTVSIKMVNLADRRPAAELEVHIRPRSFVVDRTLRLYQAEHDYLKQRLRLAPSVTPATGLMVRSSSADVVVSAGPQASGGFENEVFIKCKCGPAPDNRQFFLLAYLDPYMAQLHETWRVYVHSLKRHDMTGIVGQTSQSSVIVKGGPATCRVGAFSSHPEELAVAPPSFSLVAGALAEVLLAYRPLVPGRQDVTVHVVDVAAHRLVTAFMIATDAGMPTVSKTFEVDIPSSASTAHKKITYTNPYAATKVVTIRSTHPRLVEFRPDRLEVPPEETVYISVAFHVAGANLAAVTEVLVFINDEEDKSEECLKLRVHIGDADRKRIMNVS